MTEMTGGEFLAETMHGYGVTHFFFMPVIVDDSMVRMEQLGITRVMAHSEKPAAYMADGYARVKGAVGFCGAQSVGATNLAAGLQDAYLASFSCHSSNRAARSRAARSPRLSGSRSRCPILCKHQVQRTRRQNQPTSDVLAAGDTRSNYSVLLVRRT